MYSLLVLLSLISTIQLKQKITNNKNYKSYYFFLLLLSLTHFIGLIYVGSLLLIEFIVKIKSKEIIKTVVAGFIILIYPFFHFMYNFLYVEKNKIKLEIINLNEFNEIINLKFNQLLECNFKFLNEILGFIQLGFLNIFILLSIFLILVLSIIKASAINKKIQLIYFFIILIVLFFLFFLNLPNNIYNYIILMPVISLYFGEIISQQHQFLKFNKKISSLLIILVMLYFIGSSLITYTKMIR